MLRELHISNLAVIEDATIELGPGLNCFTGQTGAGKSLMLGALELLLGLRSAAGKEMVRPGASEARVSGVFELHDPELVEQVAAAIDQPFESGDQLLVTRKVFTSGRSGGSVNGQPATAAMLRTVGQLLVDVHGQHDHQYLLKPSNQLWILDAFGRSLALRKQFGQIAGQLRALVDQRTQMTTSSTLRSQQLDLYTFQAQEIDDAELEPGQWQQLSADHAKLTNLEKIKRDASATYTALHECEGSILERLHMAGQLLADLAEMDSELSETAEQVRSATLTLQENAYELRRYRDRLEVDPQQLADVEERLNTIQRLSAKYTDRPARFGQGDPVADLIQYRQQIGGQIDRLRTQDQDVSATQERIVTLSKKLAATGRKLRAARQAAAAKLKPQIEQQLSDLGMAEARFDVVFEEVDPSGATTGLDRIEMMIQTNPGQPARPLRMIASGGELSRIMLALKSILAHNDRVSVLVFDEIDANIGGRMGTVIGTKLRDLARATSSRQAAGGGHQVLCITHLPQIAVFADRHLHIAKAVRGVKGKPGSKQTSTTVSILKGASRIDELAQMLTGNAATATTRKQVRELLAVAGD